MKNVTTNLISLKKRARAHARTTTRERKNIKAGNNNKTYLLRARSRCVELRCCKQIISTLCLRSPARLSIIRRKLLKKALAFFPLPNKSFDEIIYFSTEM